MRDIWVGGVTIVTLVGVMVLSVMTDRAGAAPPNKPGGPALSTPTPNWDTVLSGDERFTVLAAFNNQAVRDNETGLVWEKAPTGQGTWAVARVVCLDKKVGGRKGWRLPSVHELASLIDATQPVPTLPPGHPFVLDLSGSYWSATLSADNPIAAWHVQPSNGLVSNIDRTLGISSFVWCVRGEANPDMY